jgi:hypothetical protein
MQQFEFAISVIPTGCLSAVIAKFAVPCCCVYNISTCARYYRGGSHDVNTGWPSHKLFLILFFPLKLELFTFQIGNFLKVDIFKNEIKIE